MADFTLTSLISDPDRLKRVVAKRRAALRGSLAPLGVSIEEVESDLYEFVSSMKHEGQTPERVVIVVKELLHERKVPLGLAVLAAFEQARHNDTLADAIVTLAIAHYFEVV